MRILFAADLHGDELALSRLERLVGQERPDAVVLGGDMFNGPGDEADPLQFLTGPFGDFAAGSSVPILAIPGNFDWLVTVKAMAALPNVSVLTLKPVRFGSLVFQGYPNVTPGPWRRNDFVRRDLTRDRVMVREGAWVTGPKGTQQVPPDHLHLLPSMEEELAALVGGPEAIWVTHCPPYGGGLDVIPGYAQVGSKALETAIRKLQPLITLHGHCHESPELSGIWAERRGQTFSVNPGAGDRIHAVLFETANLMGTLCHTIYGPFRELHLL